ncbi:MAG: carboxypeptidase-like regulatory domain-containing protein, partial [Thermoproteota archaeon]
MLTEPPGYQNPWGNYPATAPSYTWWQLKGNTYAPFGAILASTDDHPNTGDLIFAINFTLPPGSTPTSFAAEYFMAHGIPSTDPNYGNVHYTDVILYIPPEFEPYDVEVWTKGVGFGDPSIATTINVPYAGNQIATTKADVKDPFGPGWWIVKVPGAINFTLKNDFKEWYYIRVNNINAPKIAGRYFFKIFLNWSFPLGNSVKEDGTEADWGYVLSTMPAENWPCLLVKGEIDPGIVEGTVYALGWDPELRETPLWLPGKVELVGEAYDPYTWEPLGREVRAMGYFNASAKGHYTVEGVAPGVYDVYVSAAGYPRMKSASGIEVHPGKSVHLAVVLQPGAIVHGKIFAKHAYGEVPWGREMPVMVEIYDSNDWPSLDEGQVWGLVNNYYEDLPILYLNWEFKHLKSFSPVNLTDAPYTSYVNGPQALFERTGAGSVGGGILLDRKGVGLDNPAVAALPAGHPGVTPRAVAFPWEGADTGVAGLDSKDPNGIFNGVGPATAWWTDPASAQFEFRFGNKDYTTPGRYGIYGAPTEFDGHVPQVFATWVNGLEPGTYYLRAWVNGFVQTDAAGNYVDYVFTVASQEWAGDIYVPMDLQLTGWINKTVHFQSGAGTMKEVDVGGPDLWRFLIVEARDAAGTLVAFNFTQVPATAKNVTIQLNGFGMAGPIQWDDWDSQADSSNVYHNYDPSLLISPVGMKFFLYRYRHIRDYGLMPGNYRVYLYVRGFLQNDYESATVSLSGSPTVISNRMYRGAGINITVYSVDWQYPRINRPWVWPGNNVTVEVHDEEGRFFGEVFFFDNVGGRGRWLKPMQTVGEAMLPHRSWPIYYSKLKFNGSVFLERFGPDELVGVWTWEENDEMASCWWSVFYYGYGFLTNVGYRGSDLESRLALKEGSYRFVVNSYGYVFKDQEKYAVHLVDSTQADIAIQLTVGVNFTITMVFKKEGLITPLPFDTWIDIEVYDIEGNLVAAKAPGVGPGYTVPKGTEVITTEIGGLLLGENGFGVDGYPNYLGEWIVVVSSSFLTRDFTHGIYYPPPPGIMMGMWGDSSIGQRTTSEL